jgi:hypothetical protein
MSSVEKDLLGGAAAKALSCAHCLSTIRALVVLLLLLLLLPLPLLLLLPLSLLLLLLLLVRLLSGSLPGASATSPRWLSLAVANACLAGNTRWHM